MKIKLQEYSLISNEWIDEHIKDPLQSHLIKQQLIPSEKLADKCFHEGSWAMLDPVPLKKLKQDFLNSEIELKEYEKSQKNLYTEEQVRKLVEEANYDGQYLHAKSVTSQMMRDNAESYSESIIQSLKQPKKD